jgi:hypothetical protein
VISVKIEQSSQRLTLRFDPAVTAREKVLAAVEKVIAEIH